MAVLPRNGSTAKKRNAPAAGPVLDAPLAKSPPKFRLPAKHVASAVPVVSRVVQDVLGTPKGRKEPAAARKARLPSIVAAPSTASRRSSIRNAKPDSQVFKMPEQPVRLLEEPRFSLAPSFSEAPSMQSTPLAKRTAKRAAKQPAAEARDLAPAEPTRAELIGTAVKGLAGKLAVATEDLDRPLKDFIQAMVQRRLGSFDATAARHLEAFEQSLQ